MSMFYSEAILSRRGPLARVWLAAHYERKINKSQTLQTDIVESVDAIVGEETIPMALRLSGQLLLGVVRIYSRKAKYLLDDCNEAIIKIKMAFRPGAVDMTEDQLAVSRNAITLQGENLDIDLLVPDMNWDIDYDQVQTYGQQHIARQKDITLASADAMDLGFDDDTFDFGDGIGSNEFELDINFGAPEEEREEEREEEGTEAASVERGRRASHLGSPRISAASGFGGRGIDDTFSVDFNAKDVEPFGGFGGDDFPMDLGGEMGISFDPQAAGEEDREKTPGQTRASTRASSPLTPPPVTPPADGSFPTPSPRTADDLAKIAEREAKKKAKKNKQIVDVVTELANGPGARGRGRQGEAPDVDVSAITQEQRFLPRSRTVMALLEIRKDPVAYFMPTIVRPEGNMFYAGPPGMVPELAEMFMVPARGTRRRQESQPADTRPPKKPRTTAATPEEEEEEEDVQQRRRDSAAPPSEGFGGVGDISDNFGADTTADFGGAGMEFDQPFELGGDEGGMGEPMEIDVAGPATPKARASVRRSVAPADDTRSTPGLGDDVGEGYDPDACPIGVFDQRKKEGETQTQTQTQSLESDDMEDSRAQMSNKGYSKNTVTALGILQRGLEGDADEDEKYLSFAKLSNNASRRAASTFFFELLVLGTRDCVKLSQAEPFANIEIRGKDRLWDNSVAAPSSSAPASEH